MPSYHPDCQLLGKSEQTYSLCFILPFTFVTLNVETWQLWRPHLDLNLDQILEHSSHNTQQYLTDDSEGAGILGTLSEAGLIYVKEVLVNQILKEITPLSLPDIHSQAKSPIGQVDTTITHIELSGANVSYSDVDLGKTGITVFAGDIKARMRFHWKYECTSSYIPFPVTDGGWADVEVTGMQAGVTFTLQAHNGTLRLTVVECGTYIEDLDIELHGGASWLYQWFVYAFDDEIRAAVEGAITSAIISGARKLDTFLLGLPRSLPIDDISAVDVTVVEDPFVSPTFLSAGVKGEFISLKKPTVPLQPDHSLPPGIFCSESAKMITIAVCDYVINSAAKVYFEVHCSLLELIMLLPLVFCFLHFYEPLGSSWSFSDFAHIPSCTLLFCFVVTFFQSFIFVNLLISLSSWGCP
jgi:hypothetical protein